MEHDCIQPCSECSSRCSCICSCINSHMSSNKYKHLLPTCYWIRYRVSHIQGGYTWQQLQAPVNCIIILQDDDDARVTFINFTTKGVRLSSLAAQKITHSDNGNYLSCSVLVPCLFSMAEVQLVIYNKVIDVCFKINDANPSTSKVASKKVWQATTP